MRLKEIYDNWKGQRDQRKQQKHEELLQELAEMVDKRREELAARKENI